MSIILELPEDLHRKLLDRAARVGRSVEAVAQDLIAEGVNGATALEEILEPIRAQFRKSGMSEDDLATLVEESRSEVWQEKGFSGNQR